jgi:drug/metabolite transporter (DMT)-like permease
MNRKMNLTGIIAGLAAASIWGGMYVVSKVVLEVIPSFTLLSIRLVLGALCLLVVVLATSGFKLSRRQALLATLVGFVGFGVSVGLQFVGTWLSTAANAALVTSASPAFILLFGAWLLRERITPRRLLALALATLGVLAVIDPRAASLDRSAFLGNLALVGASVTWGLYSVLVKIASRGVSVLEVSMFALIGGLPLSVPLAFTEVSRLDMAAVTPAVWLGVLYLGVVSTALAMYLWNKSLSLLDAGVVSLLFFAQPVVGAGLGAALLGEELGLGFWLGAVLIAAGLVIAARVQGGGSIRT